MDFQLAPEIEDIRLRIHDFVEQHILPLEQDPTAHDEHENIAEGPLSDLRARAKAEGLWALQMPKQRGGGGLNVVAMAACYEEMNRSIFGPVCFNSAAPDDGNMIVLDHGSGVYTRYAHLADFSDDMDLGVTVTPRSVLGTMGKSAGYEVVVHLHYEILLGDFDTAAKSFGLISTDPMGLQHP